jgi:thiaminase (transcriptional activator TenA)
MIFNQMHAAIQTSIGKIHTHPFNQELSQGTLPLDKFIFYLMQDALYLADFSRALALTAARLTNNAHMQQFMEFAVDAIKAERELHVHYLNQYPSIAQTTRTKSAEPHPSCFMYTNYLLRMATLASVEEAVSSLLPCFFVYNEVGKKMLPALQPHNPYHDRIALYSGESFELSVNAAIEVTNELAEKASVLTQQKMQAAFKRATQLEWMFWEAAYSQEQWEDVHAI